MGRTDGARDKGIGLGMGIGGVSDEAGIEDGKSTAAGA